MVELDKSLLPMLSSYMTSRKRYVDDTITYVQTDAIEHVLSILNSFKRLTTFNMFLLPLKDIQNGFVTSS